MGWISNEALVCSQMTAHSPETYVLPGCCAPYLSRSVLESKRGTSQYTRVSLGEECLEVL